MSTSQRSVPSLRPSWHSRRDTPMRTTPPSAQHKVTPPTNISSSPKQDPYTSIDMQDDDSIRSTSSGDNIMMITPCYDYFKYGVWLRSQFPHVINMTGSFLSIPSLKSGLKMIYMYIQSSVLNNGKIN